MFENQTGASSFFIINNCFPFLFICYLASRHCQQTAVRLALIWDRMDLISHFFSKRDTAVSIHCRHDQINNFMSWFFANVEENLVNLGYNFLEKLN